MDKGIGMFKLPYSLTPPYHTYKDFIQNDKRFEEIIVGGFLITYLNVFEKKWANRLSLSKDDSNKGPDLIASINSEFKGIQVTRFVLNDYMARFNKAKNACELISKEIQKNITPLFKVNSQLWVSHKDNDFVPNMDKREFRKIASIIADKLKENIETLKNKDGFLNFDIDDLKLRKKIGGFNFQKIPEDSYSSYFGKGKVFIDLGFDNIFFKDSDIISEIEKIYESKNGGKAQILLLWSDRKELMGQDNLIIERLKKKFVKTTFEDVYFMTFLNKKNIKPDVKVTKIA